MYVLAFLFTLHISISAYVNSTFLTKIVSEKYVGLLYTVAAIITLVLLSQSARILKYFGNRKFLTVPNGIMAKLSVEDKETSLQYLESVCQNVN